MQIIKVLNFKTFIICIPLFLITSDTTVDSKSEGTNCSNPYMHVIDGDYSKQEITRSLLRKMINIHEPMI